MTEKTSTDRPAAPAVILDRRKFLKASAALSGVFIASGSLIGGTRMAYALDPFIHQLGWIKSIQSVATSRRSTRATSPPRG